MLRDSQYCLYNPKLPIYLLARAHTDKYVYQFLFRGKEEKKKEEKTKIFRA
jgi:hypothetical protein